MGASTAAGSSATATSSGLTGTALDALIERTIAYFRDETDVEDFEWKTRGHDAPADLAERLRRPASARTPRRR